MEKIEQSKKELSTFKAIVGSLLAIVILYGTKSLALSLGKVALGLGLPSAFCNVVVGLFRVALMLGLVYFLCQIFLKLPLSQLRIPRPQIRPVWALTAVAMPVLVLLLSLLSGGHWEVNRLDTGITCAIFTHAIFYYGFASGIVEEVLFRGIIMGCLEKRFNLAVAVLLPSVLFGALHIIGLKLDLLSIIQLLIAGSIVGVLFSFIAYESNSIWNSALVHGVWNIAIIGGILHIGAEADANSMLNFVFASDSFFITGGAFGIEASIISIVVYVAFAVLAAALIRRKG